MDEDLTCEMPVERPPDERSEVVGVVGVKGGVARYVYSAGWECLVGDATQAAMVQSKSFGWD